MSTSARRAVRPGEPTCPRLEREDAGGRPGVSTIWRLRGLREARAVLRARHATTQAGFTAEKIPQRLELHPILVSDGPLHDEQRRKVARFLAPKVVQERYTGLMQQCAERQVADAVADGGCRLDDVALLYTVEVTAEVVGLTGSSVPRMARRLESFFNQPPFDLTREDLGRTPGQWAAAARNGLLPVLRFWWSDVRPAVRARRRRPRQDIVSHLLAEGYSRTGILVECVTYGTAGMVTTREFISMAAWHLLSDEALLERYLSAEQEERLAVLHEIIRLEPVVGHLYRRARQPIPLGADPDHEGEAPRTVQAGELVDICVRSANADPEVVGDDPLQLRPGRELPPGVNPTGLAFGDGEHRCPGQPLAMLESDALLHRLLALRPVVLREPDLGWDDLIEGYTLRGLELGLTGEPAAPDATTSESADTVVQQSMIDAYLSGADAPDEHLAYGAVLALGGLADNAGLVGSIEELLATEGEQLLLDAVAGLRRFGLDDVADLVAHAETEYRRMRPTGDEDVGVEDEALWEGLDDEWFRLTEGGRLEAIGPMLQHP